jgi:23S rRNA (adenine2503-C2)-methyltransferase
VSATDIGSMSCQQIGDWFEQIGEPKFHGRQVYRWIHNRCVSSFSEMTNLSKPLREKLEQIASLPSLEMVDENEAEDGTVKFRFRLVDGLEIESVFMPDEKRRTLCVSTQVGCGMGCEFCATASMGMKRNLKASEITGQVESVIRKLRPAYKKRVLTNIVFMGMGEPLANLANVEIAISNLLHKEGLGISRRHITVSTVGLVPAMIEFVHRMPVKLAVSLNAADDLTRDRIMPINKKYNLEQLLRTCRNLPIQRRERITFEYVLLAGINDRKEDAKNLVKLLSGISCKVNLIPYNPHSKSAFKSPDPEKVNAFLDYLISKDLTVIVRKSRGASLKGACGQLVVDSNTHENKARS